MNSNVKLTTTRFHIFRKAPLDPTSASVVIRGLVAATLVIVMLV